jgi:hypothetical protein
MSEVGEDKIHKDTREKFDSVKILTTILLMNRTKECNKDFIALSRL